MVARILWVLLFFYCGVSYGESAQTDECDSGKANSQVIYECSKRKSKEADMILNNAYRALNEQVSLDYKAEPQLGDELKEHIKKSQRAWINLRDENCAIESFVISPGTQAFETTSNYCFARESLERARYLNNLSF